MGTLVGGEVSFEERADRHMLCVYVVSEIRTFQPDC